MKRGDKPEILHNAFSVLRTTLYHEKKLYKNAIHFLKNYLSRGTISAPWDASNT